VPALAGACAKEESVPTYQYTCTECGDPVEVVQKFTDEPLTVCSACGGRLRKVFSPVGIVFKGSGFYRTDSRKGSSVLSADKPEKSEKSEKSTSDAGVSSSSSNGSDSASNGNKESKPAVKKAGEAAAASSKSSSSREKVA
jgi:putative FmdB family regulatory protein